MDKKAIKTFSINARTKLREDIKYKMKLIGILENTILKPSKKYSNKEIHDIDEDNPKILFKEGIQQRNNLIKVIEEKGYNNVIEDITYTIFNRLIIIRFLEINNYLSTKTRVLSSKKRYKIEPDIITHATDIDLNLDKKEIAKIYSLKNKDKLDELFQFLFIKQCNELYNILPKLFEKIPSYYELLVPLSFSAEDGVVRELIDTISEDNFKNQVEIIGWMYQYYNLELKEDTFKQVKKHIKISKERIPVATQMFTPDWIVKYMVENSLGKLWLENHPNDKLKKKWKYYISGNEKNPKNQEKIELSNLDDKTLKDKTLKDNNFKDKNLKDNNFKDKNLKLEEIKVIDPCMGSGHILVYVFDLLMEIYLSKGYSKKDATISILKNNLFGLDVDDRAYKLTYFAVMMKARSFYPHIFKESIRLNLLAIQESSDLSQEEIDYLSKVNHELRRSLNLIKNIFIDAKDFGSLIDERKLDYNKIRDMDLIINKHVMLAQTEFSEEIKNKLIPLIHQAQLLFQKYDVLVTNPPYMGKRGMNKKLLDFLKVNYKENKKDLFSAFIERSFYFLKENGYAGFLTPFVWMFISSYQKLREDIIKNRTLTSLIQFEYSAFEEATVPICAFTFKNRNENSLGRYIKLSDFRGGMKVQETKTLEAINNSKCNYFFEINQEEFLNIPENPIAFWVEKELISIFKNTKKLSDIAEVRQGLATTNNKKFLRYWHEVNFNKIGFGYNREDAEKSNKKWFPYNKGGKYRKWFGNEEFIVNWQNDGEEIKKMVKEKYKDRTYAQDFTDSQWKKLIRVWVVKNIEFYFKESITWSFISSSYFSARYSPQGSVFDVAGSSMFPEKGKIKYLTGLMCSKISTEVMSILNPTINFQVGDLKNIPVIFDDKYKITIEELVDENINISKEEWDYFEESQNFSQHPLIKYKGDDLIENSFNNWKKIAKNNFYKVKGNEERINKIFIDIYNLKSNLSPNLEDKDITLRKADLKRDVKSFLSYFIGCLFGRYSLDKEGLIFSGGDYDSSNYIKFIPNEDNIAIISDIGYFEGGKQFKGGKHFEEDIVNKFIEFLKVTFSEETLEENIKFIANALGNNGKNPRETIHKYFSNDFYKDHIKIYKKTPIYWLFDSGKKNGFKALIYIHRYTPDIVGKIRAPYLQNTQKTIKNYINNNKNLILNSINQKEKNELKKVNIKLKKQLEETIKYDEALESIASKQIMIDLDDGIKVNYGKFQNVELGDKNVNLLKRI